MGNEGASGADPFPVWLSTFIGREAERKTLGQLLDERRLVTMIGSGGCGKTRLAAKVAQDRAARGNEARVWFAALEPVTEADQVAPTVRAALGAVEQAWRSPIDTAADWIGAQPGLLVVDNGEHLAVAAARTVQALLARCPTLTVLVTSRQPLGVDGELVWDLPPLELPRNADHPRTAASYDAVQLFADRAQLARHDFELTEASSEVVVELVRRLDGIPLAIELAAARLSMMTLEQILDGLDQRFGLLTRSSPGGDDRHQTLLASVDWSYRLLSPPEQAVLGRLAVFAGHFSLDDARQVVSDRNRDRDTADVGEMDDGAVGAGDVVQLVGNLVARSLVVVDRTEGPHRYRLLETIRAYARERLAEAGPVTAWRDRHLDWAAALVEEAEPALDTPDQAAWLVRLELDHANLAEALAYARTRRPSTALAMAAGLSLFWKLRGHFGEARATLRALLEAAEPPDGAERRAAQWALADVCYWMGGNDEAVAQAQLALEASQVAGDGRIAGRSLWTLAMVAELSDLDQARRDGLAAIELAQTSGDRWLEGVSRQVVGVSARMTGDQQEARRQLEASLQLSLDQDVPQLVACSWAMVQWLEVDVGDFERADHAFEAGMAAARRILDPATPAYLADAHSEALHHRGRIDEARALLEEVIADLYASGARTYEPFLHHRLAVTLMAHDDDDAAAEIERITDLAEPAAAHLAFALLAQAWLALSRGESDARSTTEQALDVARLVGPRTTVEHLVGAGLSHLVDDPVGAAERFHEALALADEIGLALWVPEALDGLAASFARRGLDLVAARLFGAADGIRRQLGTVRLPVAHRVIGSIELESQLRLGPDHAADRAAGAQLTARQAIVHARRNRGRRRRPITGWDSLTPTEEQVVRLAADGLTNPQIAAHLFVSNGTIKTHLGHAFAKLGVANRTELASIVARLPA